MSIMDDYKQLQMIENIKKIRQARNRLKKAGNNDK